MFVHMRVCVHMCDVSLITVLIVMVSENLIFIDGIGTLVCDTHESDQKEMQIGLANEFGLIILALPVMRNGTKSIYHVPWASVAYILMSKCQDNFEINYWKYAI